MLIPVIFEEPLLSDKVLNSNNGNLDLNALIVTKQESEIRRSPQGYCISPFLKNNNIKIKCLFTHAMIKEKDENVLVNINNTTIRIYEFMYLSQINNTKHLVHKLRKLNS